MSTFKNRNMIDYDCIYERGLWELNQKVSAKIYEGYELYGEIVRLRDSGVVYFVREVVKYEDNKE